MVNHTGKKIYWSFKSETELTLYSRTNNVHIRQTQRLQLSNTYGLLNNANIFIVQFKGLFVITYFALISIHCAKHINRHALK